MKTSSSDGRRLRVLKATLYVLGPVADVFVRVEDEVYGTGHVMLALSFAHVVHRAVVLVWVVRYVVVFLIACDLVRCKINI